MEVYETKNLIRHEGRWVEYDTKNNGDLNAYRYVRSPPLLALPYLY